MRDFGRSAAPGAEALSALNPALQVEGGSSEDISPMRHKFQILLNNADTAQEEAQAQSVIDGAC